MTNTQRIIDDTDMLIEKLTDFYTPSEITQWFISPQKLLKGETPSSLVVQGRTEEVLQLIYKLRTGAYI